MSQSLAEVRQFIRDLDSQHCPVAQRQRQLREEKIERERKEREARRQQDDQQGAAARNSEAWNNWAHDRIKEHLLAVMERGGWLCEVIGGALGKKAAEVRKDALAEVATLRRELVEATAKLQERLARLPRVEEFQPETVYYTGDVVVCDGATYQAKKDTGQKPGHSDWILLARGGRDAIPPCILGAFDAQMAYVRLDVVEYDGNSYVAVRDLDPGTIPGEDGWQLLARRGQRGPVGERGERGRKGEKGARGEDSPTIVAWTLDTGNYVAHPTLSNGRAGAPLDLRPLFVQFHDAVIQPALTEAVQDAARTAKQLWP
jgi:hypothetical protein